MRSPLAAVLAALALAFVALPALGEKDAGPPPEKYICPNSAGATAVDCFLGAVDHLYTMCRQVKSIEILEFGYAKSEEGVNGAKSEYCIDKHRLSITRPYQAALREATGNHTAVDALRAAHELWLKELSELKWRPPETDAEYKARIARAYDAFREQELVVRAAIASAPAKVAAKPPRGAAKKGTPN
jgi:hypothetical protein